MILVEKLSSIILFVVKAVDIFNLKNISGRNINAYKKDDIMIRIKGGNLSGKVQAITSKSMAHRQIICSALSNTDTTLFIPIYLTTLNVLFLRWKILE